MRPCRPGSLAALAAGLCLSIAPGRPVDPHVKVEARVEPERVLPGGWIDVIAEIGLDPGWHATSPLSPNGPRVAFTCTVPAGLVPLGDVLVEEPTPGVDPALGKVELLEGKVELRRRYAVPSEASPSSHSVEISVGWTVCDAFRCLPRASVAAQASFAVDPDRGRIAPAPARTTAIAPPHENERRLLAEKGYAVRARQEGECAPGEPAFVLLEFLVEPGSTLKIRTTEPRPSSVDLELEERTKGFERLPLCLPVDSRNGEATLDRACRAYQVFRTSPDLAPGSYEIPYQVSAACGHEDAWVEQRLSLRLVLVERR